MISEAFVPSVGNDGQVGRFIGGCSGTVLVLFSGIITFVKCSSNSMGVYMYPPFDQGWCTSSHPSPTYLIRICSLRYLYQAAFVFNLSNSQKTSTTVFEQRGELYCWWRYDAFMKFCIDAFSLFSFANFPFAQTSLLVTAAFCWNPVKLHWHASALSQLENWQTPQGVDGIDSIVST